MDSVHSVRVYVTNRVGESFIAFQLTLKGENSPAPDIAPLFRTSGLDFNIDAGASQTIDLRTLLSRGKPTPAFTITDKADFTDLGGTAEISGTMLTVTAPMVDADLNRGVHVTARNSQGAVNAEIVFHVKSVTAPVWQTIPHQKDSGIPAQRRRWI